MTDREVANLWLRAFQSKDVSLLKLADGFVHHSPFGEIRGRDTYLNLVRENEEAFFGNPIQIVDFVDGGDRFAIRYVVGAMPACDVIYVSDGQIAEIYSYYHYGDRCRRRDEIQICRQAKFNPNL